MLRSLNSAVTGLKAMQTSMDVIANNIANVDTNGFKSSDVNFSDMFYQTLNGGTATTNPSQVGYGAKVASVDKNMDNVGATETDSASDLYIDGDGFFLLNTSKDGSGTTLYSRVGNFSVNNEGYLVDSNGNYVLGVTATASGAATTYTEGGAINLESGNSLITLKTEDGDIIPITSAEYGDVKDITYNGDGTITATYGNYTGTLQTSTASSGGSEINYGKLTDVTYDSATGTYTAKYSDGTTGAVTLSNTQDVIIGLATFANPDGLSEEGNCNYVATKSSGTASCFQADTGNSVVLRSGYLEMSNVDLASEFTNMITAERAYQANSRVITVSDSMLEELVNLKRS